MKRRHLIWIAAAVVLVVLNTLVVQKERFLANGESVYLELAPVDPRSLIQGDYMRLRYEVGDDIDDALSQRSVHRGTAVVSVDERGVAHFQRLGDDLEQDNERLLRWKRKDGRITIGADAFYFQEGRREHFEQAEFGEVKAHDDGKTLLVGLRDDALEPL
ncbi:MAG: GDYXXLXY domain-containing protein [Persicimonas sp.]